LLKYPCSASEQGQVGPHALPYPGTTELDSYRATIQQLGPVDASNAPTGRRNPVEPGERPSLIVRIRHRERLLDIRGRHGANLIMELAERVAQVGGQQVAASAEQLGALDESRTEIERCPSQSRVDHVRQANLATP